jgi:transposase
LFRLKKGEKKGKLTGFEQEIIAEIFARNYHTRQQIADMIEDRFGVKVSLSTISTFLKKHNIKRLKCGSLPAKADPELQRAFYNDTLRPLMDEAKSGRIKLFFVDASHFVFGGDFLGYIYGRERRVIKTFSGRARYNVLGALDMVSKKVTTVTNTSYISAEQVCELLKKIAEENVGIPVYLVLDNARYQKCKKVQSLAAELGLNLVFIPPYSPNLNLIERYWKHVKGRLRTKYYDNFEEFCQTINSIINSENVKDKKALESLIGEKVQLFDDLTQIDESTFSINETRKMAA